MLAFAFRSILVLQPSVVAEPFEPDPASQSAEPSEPEPPEPEPPEPEPPEPEPSEPEPSVPFESTAPFESPAQAPGDEARTEDAEVAPVATPLEPAPVEPTPPASSRANRRKPAREPVPRRALIVRPSLAFGPAWRLRPIDALVRASLEVGRAHGVSGLFDASLVPRDARRGPGVPAVTEATLGLGAVVRGRLKRPFDGSLGLTAGIRIHRAATDQGVLHRVDPDFTLPLQGAWTIRGIGLHVALVPGYSVRARAYERRGAVIWDRSAFRVALLFGVHWDVWVGRRAAEDGGRPRGDGR